MSFNNTVLDSVLHTKMENHIDCVSQTLVEKISIMNQVKYFVLDSRYTIYFYFTFNYDILILVSTNTALIINLLNFKN